MDIMYTLHASFLFGIQFIGPNDELGEYGLDCWGAIIWVGFLAISIQKNK